MENNKKTGVLYVKGIGLNFIPVIFSLFFKVDQSSENFLFVISLFFFFFSFLFYVPYFCLTIKNLNQIERIIFLFSPCLLYIALILIFYYTLPKDTSSFFVVLVFSPFIILNFIYALYLELTLRKKNNE
jgi:hypothetical protein